MVTQAQRTFRLPRRARALPFDDLHDGAKLAPRRVQQRTAAGGISTSLAPIKADLHSLKPLLLRR